MIPGFLRRACFALPARRRAGGLAEPERPRASAQAAMERGGLSPADAAARSRRAMGNVTLAREDACEVWSVHRAWRGTVYEVRPRRRESIFALAILVTLTPGSVTTITVFSVADDESWKPLPFPGPAALGSVEAITPATRVEPMSTLQED